MFISEIVIENFRTFGEGESKFVFALHPGLTALVGQNDTGKTTIIDALRYVLGTRDQEYIRIEDSDFHWPLGEPARRTEIRIRCKFDDLTIHDKGAFAEYLTIEDNDGRKNSVLYAYWTAKDRTGTRNKRRFISSELKSGENGDGPTLDAEVRTLLRATYLRPLRDAERAMSAGRGSRLSQILQHTKEVKEVGIPYGPDSFHDTDQLSVLGVGDYATALLETRKGIKMAHNRLNKDYLKELAFSGDGMTGHISVSQFGDDESRLRQILENLELELRHEGDTAGPANRGLGSNNLLYMACELLLIDSEEEELPLLLIEEPEAHLHPQRQLRLMQFLQKQAEVLREDGQQMQIVVTTHSPNLASAIRLQNLVLIQEGRAFPLTEGKTRLDRSDYGFLERFLDVTKANLFFARGLLIVEGDAENILVPTLARLIGRDLTEHGVSIVNVGGTGLRRFARIFQRMDEGRDGTMKVPVACVADMDVMPDCAPPIVGWVKAGEDWPDKGTRRWRAKSDFTEEQLAERRKTIREKANGQCVQTFVSDHWTLEYDLAYSGLAKDVWIAAHLAKSDDQINAGKKQKELVITEATISFTDLNVNGIDPEILASNVYALFTTGAKASKAVVAQYLAQYLEERITNGDLTGETLQAKLPSYLISAIDYVIHAPNTNGDTSTTSDQSND